MSIEQVTTATPANLMVFNDTSIGSGAVSIKSSPIKLYYASVDNTQNPTASYLKIWGTTAFGSITVGSTAPDIILYVPASSVLYVNFQLDGATPGTTFNQCSAACVTSGGTGGTTPPASPVNFTLAFV